MNFLLEITTINYLTVHQMVIKLAEMYPGSRFGIIISFAPGGDHVERFLRQQKDIRYEFLGFRHDFLREAMAMEIDDDLLARFEETIPEKSLWRLIAADKFLGDAFLHDVVMPETYLRHFSREQILKMFSGLIKCYQLVFEGFKPDVFLPALNMGSITVYILRYLCEQFNLPYMTPASLRVGNYVAYAANTLLTMPQIEEAYRDIKSGRQDADLVAAENLYRQLMSELENSQYFDRQQSFHRIVKLDTFGRKVKHLSMIPKQIAIVIREWFRKGPLNRSGDLRGQPYRLSTLWRNLDMAVNLRLQSYRLLQPDFGTVLPPEQKYLYYPLQTIPEYSTNFMGTMWMDQLHLIELLAKSVPHDWVVYVKEHPATLPVRLRPHDFFDRLRRIPNVVLAPLDANYHQLIVHAQMVAVVTGTTGWEAIQRGKPVLTLARNFFDVMELSHKCTDLELMAAAIKEEYRRSKAIAPEERKRRLVCFLAAIKKHGFEVTHAPQYFYEAGTPEQYRSAGSEAAEGLKKHLDYLQSRRKETVPC